MAVLDQITEMKRQGMPTGQIIKNLREHGISAKEINEALSQSEIKSEIYGDYEKSQGNVFPMSPEDYKAVQSPAPVAGMTPSISQSTEQYTEAEEPYPQRYQEYAPQEYYPENYYQEYQPPQSTDIQTISDVSSQIAEEKTKKLQKEISLLVKFKAQSEEKIKEINKRLEKIENIIDELQITILKKIGSYGENIEKISKEIKSTQDSFSKVINPLIGKTREQLAEKSSKRREMKKISDDKTTDKKTGATFEDFLR